MTPLAEIPLSCSSRLLALGWEGSAAGSWIVPSRHMADVSKDTASITNEIVENLVPWPSYGEE